MKQNISIHRYVTDIPYRIDWASSTAEILYEL
jgi:hypothetical protein